MPSLVSEFIINPVLRQARRFSEISRATLAGDDEASVAQSDAVKDSDDAADDAGQQGPDATPERRRPRPLSSSTQETIVEEVPAVADEAPAAPAADPGPLLDHLGFPITPPRTASNKDGPIPEDDGMRKLRTRIQEINAREISSGEKARLMHDTLLEGYRASYWQSQLIGEPSVKEVFVLSESDKAPTYAPVRHSRTPSAATPTHSAGSLHETRGPLGCEHYERNVKLQCSTCKKWYTCRFCHDAHEDHTLIRKDTKNMLCMLCATPQKASEVCNNCGEVAAQYYCNICKLWENRTHKPIYHCNDCGICRRGMGLGKDFFHCKTCRTCITTSIESSHKCIERSTDCDCPICGEYMFTSPKRVVFMNCGHSIHKKCYDQHLRTSYKCPICNKSLVNMEPQFRNLDLAILSQPMPPDFRDTKAKILCNDCSARSTVAYHWLGLKCSICRSYNTVELQILGRNVEALQPAAGDQPQLTREAGPEDAGPGSRRISITAGSRGPNRRRHSSNAPELPSRFLERYARSMSPSHMMMDIPQAAVPEVDEESDDDILGFWRSGEDDDEDDDDEYDSDESSDDDHPEADDDDEEDEDEFNLIGHR
ncbi:zf-CHY-domain-containing protein [Trichoderma citrinoviride]|uniref:Zf-CHY-domain-containing protein n=1 Tax=Trichoderma citrinoviride TaxID=58853 RepID=A0A2T4B3L9_9HYPO|nr:zf-CHY-domain-containing protein [Trichoderma citrinoviride]PTB63818.1 zf-CHY-domain-containing protein [Trichoderma citrinoviride]